MAEKIIHVLGFSGSLRKASFNTAALRAAREVLPDDMTMETFDLSGIPVYNEDVLSEKGFPDIVQKFRERIAAADALLIVTPEYNYSIPGTLKNAIDWASRAPNQPLNDKPVAIMGASTGNYGTARAQYHLRQVCVFTNMHPINKPEVLITRAPEKFNAEGKLIDEPTRDVIRKMLESLAAWTRRLQKN
ncbi:MAG TPA: NAD(P)H-dependent oxidoreductase [Candidatus Kapabacteria bacterium]|nr:NAD(P)H-dependent oxidoreductase [Candidatus Kapabacteria bacterium]